jgi:ectoine hydroxylase-related dioxygenase (phytanoyl-CoA dioxygenase family)
MVGRFLVRHPLNTGFAWRPAVGPFRRVTEEQATAYDELGYFEAEGLVPAAVRRELLRAVDLAEEEVTGFLRRQPGGRLFIADAEAITFSPHLVTRVAAARALAASSTLVELAVDLLGPDVRLYWDQAVYKKPEPVRVFPWHQDNGYTFIEPQQYLTCWVALTDATVENGCPWVAPGWHLEGTLAHRAADTGLTCFDEDPPGAVPVEAAAGSVVVFSSLTPHRTGPNRTDAVRKAYIVQYAPEGAETLRRDEHGEIERRRQDDPDRQFVVATGGRPVAVAR